MASREEVYAKFGLAAEAAQLFETELGTMLLALKGQERGWHLQANPEEAAKFYDELNRRTLGQILAGLRQRIDLDEHGAETFDRALRARNRLNHGFFERHDFAIFAEAGRDAMLDELETLHSQLTEAYKVAQHAATRLVARVQATKVSKHQN